MSSAGACFWDPNPKLRQLSRFDWADLGFYGLAGLAGIYVRVRGIGAPIRSKARRWVGVGVASLSTGWPLTRMVSRVRVARWSSRSRKPRMGCLPGPVLKAALAAAAGERRAGATGLAAGGRVLVGVGQRRPGPAQVPGQVAGEHADQHVGPDAVFEPVPDGPQVQVVGLDVPEVPFEAGQVLVGGHSAGRRRGYPRGRGCG